MCLEGGRGSFRGGGGVCVHEFCFFIVYWCVRLRYMFILVARRRGLDFLLHSFLELTY